MVRLNSATYSSRVSPKKSITIPRLELTAATVAAKLGAMIKDELNMPAIEQFFWTDSKICLGYISNEHKRFRIFVSNRCQKIRSLTESKQWRYISTDENPADLASKGMKVTEIPKKHHKAPEVLAAKQKEIDNFIKKVLPQTLKVKAL